MSTAVSATIIMGDTMNCEFNNPVDYEGNPPADLGTAWNWSQATCDYTEKGLQEISDGTHAFYVSPKVNLFEIFILGLVPMIAIVLIFKVVWGFFHPQIVKFKKE